MEIRHLKTFLAVARRLSFYKAAEQLHYAQSSVSAQIRNLEQELNVKLFDRLGRQVILTEAGARLRHYAAKMVDLASETREAFLPGKELSGSLTIRAPESFAVCRLPAVLKRFHERHPRVSVRFITCAREGLARDLQKGVTDLAFLLDDSITGADLEVELLKTEPLALVCGRGHALENRETIETRDLAGQKWLFSRADCSYRRLVAETLRLAGAEVSVPAEMDSLAAIKQCVRIGLGISVLPLAAAAQELARNELAAPDWLDGPQETGLLMIWHRQRWLSPLLSAFMDCARSRVCAP